MDFGQTLQHEVFEIDKPYFEQTALLLFRYQAQYNAIYRQFLEYLRVDPFQVSSIQEIPFLPVELFKQHTIITGTSDYEHIFTSSGTTGMVTSRHYVRSLALYEQSFTKAFTHFYGPIQNYCLLALLPAYLEREGSSLVYMADQLIQQSTHPQSGFYLDDYQRLVQTIRSLEAQKQPTILLGVSFALWDVAEQFELNLEHTIVMETGGMKGRRKEVIREELHEIYRKGFGVQQIHSEYGMTELLSQAYSKGEGLFQCPPWMRVQLREVNDPFQCVTQIGQTGAINIIDLANINSCAFIATSDLGKLHPNNNFEVLGRMDSSDMRGCNLLVF